jgi:hypothetical protein
VLFILYVRTVVADHGDSFNKYLVASAIFTAVPFVINLVLAVMIFVCYISLNARSTAAFFE